MFCHLHVHTRFSARDSLVQIPELIDKVVEFGMDSVACTDHGNMNAHYEFYHKARAKNIKPIFGIEMYMAFEGHDDKKPYELLSEAFGKRITAGHVLLLAKNRTGYDNLKFLNQFAYRYGFYFKPRIDREVLKDHSDGLICLSACIGGLPQRFVLGQMPDKALETIRWFQSVFGDRYFLEIQDHGMPEQKIIIDVFTDYSNQLGIPLVATNDVHYLTKKEAKFHNAIMAKQFHQTLEELEKDKPRSGEEYFKSESEMRYIFENQQAIDQTQEIADSIETFDIFYPQKQRFYFPRFNVSDSEIVI